MFNHLDMRLYFAMCNSHSLPERRWHKGIPADHPFDTPGHERNIYMNAIKIIGEHLNGTWPVGVQFGAHILVNSEQEAKSLIDYAEQNVQRSSGLIEPHDCMHGIIRFFRKIRFEGYSEKDIDGLVGRMKESGYQASDIDWNRAFSKLT